MGILILHGIVRFRFQNSLSKLPFFHTMYVSKFLGLLSLGCGQGIHIIEVHGQRGETVMIQCALIFKIFCSSLMYISVTSKSAKLNSVTGFILVLAAKVCSFRFTRPQIKRRSRTRRCPAVYDLMETKLATNKHFTNSDIVVARKRIAALHIKIVLHGSGSDKCFNEFLIVFFQRHSRTLLAYSSFLHSRLCDRRIHVKFCCSLVVEIIHTVA